MRLRTDVLQPMIRLGRLLLCEKWRKHLVQYGWTGCASLGAVLAALAWAAAAGLTQLLRHSPQVDVFASLNQLWLFWVLAGVFLGRDLTWRIRIDRLMAFPLAGIHRAYALCFLLSFASFPLLLALLAFEVAGWRIGRPSVASNLAILSAFGLLVASIRLAGSIARASLLQSDALPKGMRAVACILVFILAGCIALSFFHSGFAMYLPGAQFGLVLTGASFSIPLLQLAGLVLLLTLADSAIQRSIAFSGITGPAAPESRWLSRGSLLLARGGGPAVLWRISLMGWLRHRNALMMLVFGSLYCFCFTYLTEPDGMLLFYAFCWMALVYHAYLRGNLLGVDHESVWLYYMFPQPAEHALRQKNRTLSLLQAGMMASVMLPALFHPVPGTDAASWLSLASYAYSSLLLDEILGSYFSLRYPDPIERSSHFSGGMTAGALTLPFVNLFFLAAFGPAAAWARRFAPPAVFWLFLMVVPGAFHLMRSAVLPGWIRKTMLRDREVLISKLRVISP